MEEEYASVAMVFYLFAVLCDYWARSTNRSAWGWFFFGLFLTPIAGLVLLHENDKDLRNASSYQREVARRPGF